MTNPTITIWRRNGVTSKICANTDEIAIYFEIRYYYTVNSVEDNTASVLYEINNRQQSAVFTLLSLMEQNILYLVSLKVL